MAAALGLENSPQALAALQKAKASATDRLNLVA